MCLADGGRSMVLNAYADGASVDFYVNGVLATSANVSYYEYATAVMSYVDGNVTAVSRDASGQVLASHTRLTPGAPVRLRLSLDAPSNATGTGSAVYLDGQVCVCVCLSLCVRVYQERVEIMQGRWRIIALDDVGKEEGRRGKRLRGKRTRQRKRDTETLRKKRKDER